MAARIATTIAAETVAERNALLLKTRSVEMESILRMRKSFLRGNRPERVRVGRGV
jgi:hypothetical protein